MTLRLFHIAFAAALLTFASTVGASAHGNHAPAEASKNSVNIVAVVNTPAQEPLEISANALEVPYDKTQDHDRDGGCCACHGGGCHTAALNAAPISNVSDQTGRSSEWLEQEFLPSRELSTVHRPPKSFI
jgi:hypothetical protein